MVHKPGMCVYSFLIGWCIVYEVVFLHSLFFGCNFIGKSYVALVSKPLENFVCIGMLFLYFKYTCLLLSDETVVNV